MTKREAAERNVKRDFMEPWPCGDCSLKSKCTGTCLSCSDFTKQWLKDNPVDDWQELKIDDLPGDILTGDYEWEILQGDGWEGARAEDNSDFRIIALQDLKSEKKYRVDIGGVDILKTVKYRYRKRQPEKEERSGEITAIINDPCRMGTAVLLSVADIYGFNIGDKLIFHKP